MEQLIAHLFGDYILQSDWMAQNKTKRAWPAFVHALTYSVLFLAIGARPMAFVVIAITHFFIDRYRLARYVVFAKSSFDPPRCYYWQPDATGKFERRFNGRIPLSECPTGYPPDTPIWLATWLLIIADNTLHLTINYLALKFL